MWLRIGEAPRVVRRPNVFQFWKIADRRLFVSADRSAKLSSAVGAKGEVTTRILRSIHRFLEESGKFSHNTEIAQNKLHLKHEFAEIWKTSMP